MKPCLNLHLLAPLALAALLPLSALAGEVFPSVKLEDEIHTNVRVEKANPVELVLHWDGGSARVLRTNLPPELAVKYPYDPKEAAAWEREQAEPRRQQAERQREEVYQGLVRREARLKATIQNTQQELKVLQERIGVLGAKAKGMRKGSLEHQELNAARDRKLDLLAQLHRLEAELEAARKQVSLYR